jgi:hypothetical protein
MRDTLQATSRKQEKPEIPETVETPETVNIEIP